jgi:hypothetical protein
MLAAERGTAIQAGAWVTSCLPHTAFSGGFREIGIEGGQWQALAQRQLKVRGIV